MVLLPRGGFRTSALLSSGEERAGSGSGACLKEWIGLSLTEKQIIDIISDEESRGWLNEAFIHRQHKRLFENEAYSCEMAAREAERKVQSKHNLDFVSDVALGVIESHLFRKDNSAILKEVLDREK